MSACEAVTHHIPCSVDYPGFDSWNKKQIITAVVGAVILILAVALKGYRGLNVGVVGSLLTTGLLIEMLNLIWIRKNYDEQKLLFLPQSVGCQVSSSQLLANVIENDNVATLVKFINKNIVNCPQLLNEPIDGKTPLQRAVAKFNEKPDLNSCYKVVILLHKGATTESIGKDKLTPFASMCQEIFNREGFKLTDLERIVINKFLNKMEPSSN